MINQTIGRPYPGCGCPEYPSIADRVKGALAGLGRAGASAGRAVWAHRRELHLIAFRALVRYIRAQWRALPGPWPVKVLLITLAVAEPGPFGEMALGAYTNAVSARRAARERVAR